MVGKVPDRRRIRVATMNVLGPANPDWDRRSALIAETLQGLDPDVVALQEVPVADGTALVEGLVGPGYTITPFSRPADDGGGGALATRGAHEVLDEVDQRNHDRSGSLP